MPQLPLLDDSVLWWNRQTRLARECYFEERETEKRQLNEKRARDNRAWMKRYREGRTVKNKKKVTSE